MVFSPSKPPGSYRIFLFGESAALGDPRPAFGMARYLEVLLQERYPSTRFEVIPAAMTAINSHALLPAARECAKYQGDLWIIYMGHNEMVGPFGANTVFGSRAPPVWAVRAYLALEATRCGQALVALGRHWRPPKTDRSSWEGMKMFLGSETPVDDPRKQTVYASFAANLADMIKAGLGAGAQVVLCNPASNLRDCPPFASRHGSNYLAAESPWKAAYADGLKAQAEGRLAEARQALAVAAGQDDRFAELQYRLASLALADGELAPARLHFTLARDYDALPFRADSRLSGTITNLAARFAARGVRCFDAADALATVSSNRVPGRELFFEHVHLTPRGNYQVALGLADQVAGLLPPQTKAGAGVAWAPPEWCDQRLGLSAWNWRAVLENVLARLADAPFTNQLEHTERVRFLSGQLRDWARQAVPANQGTVRSNYLEALRRAPRDFHLQACYGEFLEMSGQFKEAVPVWQGYCDQLPHHFLGFFELGRTQARLQQYAEAAAALTHSLRLRPDYVDSYLELGRVLAAQHKPEEALQQFALAARLRPEDARVPFERAGVLADLKRRPECLASLREAIRLRPSYWQARYYLGVELAVDGAVQLAAEEFAWVVRLRPEFPLAHLNLGTALARQGRYPEAEAQFRETLRLQPDNQAAAQQLRALRSLLQTSPLPSEK